MVEYELTQIVTMVSQVASALGVCVAAAYYVMNIRNADREKRRQKILMRMPAMDKEWYDNYWNLYYTLQGDYTDKEWREKTSNPESRSKWSYILNYFNLVGVLYAERLMTIEDIVKVYAPAGIINMFERNWKAVVNNRFNSYGKDSDANYMVPLESLYRELKHRYPGIEGFPSSTQEREERDMRREETVYSKITKEEFLASVKK